MLRRARGAHRFRSLTAAIAASTATGARSPIADATAATRTAITCHQRHVFLVSLAHARACACILSARSLAGDCRQTKAAACSRPRRRLALSSDASRNKKRLNARARAYHQPIKGGGVADEARALAANRRCSTFTFGALTRARVHDLVVGCEASKAKAASRAQIQSRSAANAAATATENMRAEHSKFASSAVGLTARATRQQQIS